GIPVVKHGKYNNIYIPELVMGNLLAGSNFDDDKARLVGGRHGYGAKLTNIFSSEFSVETADTKEKLHYKQVWKNNMSECVPPEIRPLQPGETDFTQVSFKVDLKRFKIAKLDQDTVDLWSRRVWDVAGCNPSVKCFLNSKRCKVRHAPSISLPPPLSLCRSLSAVMVEGMSERWKVFVATNPGKSGSLSFVNSVATTRGGTHLKAILDQIAGKALAVAKKTDTGLSVTDLQAKRAVFLVVAAQIENPVFDSQTKEQLVTTPAQFGSSPEISDKELKRMSRGNQDKELEKNVKKMAGSAASGSSKLRLSIPKLEDANWAGGGKSEQCTLILTEGDSAKVGSVLRGTDLGRYGVFPLKGKLLNVREASHKAVLPPSHCLGITLQFTAPTMRLTAVHCPYHAANVCTHQPCG
ncbi:histidine kinase-like ATPase, partial [Baffinella frigidus]